MLHEWLSAVLLEFFVLKLATEQEVIFSLLRKDLLPDITLF